jgi:hypothetical protein
VDSFPPSHSSGYEVPCMMTAISTIGWTVFLPVRVLVRSPCMNDGVATKPLANLSSPSLLCLHFNLTQGREQDLPHCPVVVVGWSCPPSSRCHFCESDGLFPDRSPNFCRARVLADNHGQGCSLPCADCRRRPRLVLPLLVRFLDFVFCANKDSVPLLKR